MRVAQPIVLEAVVRRKLEQQARCTDLAPGERTALALRLRIYRVCYELWVIILNRVASMRKQERSSGSLPELLRVIRSLGRFCPIARRLRRGAQCAAVENHRGEHSPLCIAPDKDPRTPTPYRLHRLDTLTTSSSPSNHAEEKILPSKESTLG